MSEVKDQGHSEAECSIAAEAYIATTVLKLSIFLYWRGIEARLFSA